MRCPCRKKSESTHYADCCQPFHAGTSVPPTAEALMRSRYAAFVIENSLYLHATWHPATRPAMITFISGQEWLALRVIATSTHGDQATVEFSARSRIHGRSQELQEVSRFVREGRRWLYVDGEIRTPR